MNDKKFCEILRRATPAKNPCGKASVAVCAFNKLAGIDSGPATKLRRGFHQRGFLTTIAKFPSLTRF